MIPDSRHQDIHAPEMECQSENAIATTMSTVHKDEAMAVTSKRKHETLTTSELNDLAAQVSDDGSETNNHKIPKLCPYQLFMNKLQQFSKDFVCVILVKGLPKANDDVSDDEEEDECTIQAATQYTADDMKALRYIMISKNRKSMIGEIRVKLLGEEAARVPTVIMVGAGFSGKVKRFYYTAFKKRYNKSEWAQKFDLLLALTWVLNEYDSWLVESDEGGLEKMVKDLAQLWKKLLSKSDAEIGIDSQYTRPGIVCLLKRFKVTVESTFSDPPFRFKFQ